MQDLRKAVLEVVPYPWPVLLRGMTGTGKRRIARFIHDASPRGNGPFVQCFLNNLAGDTAKDELFGHAKGAYTHAVTDRAGKIELSNAGTLFLDQIDDAPLDVQGGLLQPIEQGLVERKGENRVRVVDVRVVAATNIDLLAAVADGRFREDLYYRVSRLDVTMPALAEHVEDIPELVVHKLNLLGRQAEVEPPVLGRAELDRLMQYDWPGNVRELENVLIKRIVHGALPPLIGGANWREGLDDALARHRGKISAVARELGVSRPTVYRALEERGGAAPRGPASPV